MHIAIILILIFFPFNNHVEAKKIESEVSIIPQPAFVQYTSDGFFSLSSRTAVLLYDSDDLELVVDDFISQFYNASGIKLNKTCQYNLKFFDNQIRFVNDVDLADEEYHVKINKNQIIVSCASNAGAFYAIQTLKQLLPVDIYSKTQIRKDHVNLKLLEIRDKPRFKYRGLMLDVSRHYMPVSFIKELIDVMSLLKLNRFHWHLTDDQGWRIEIKKYPLLTEFGSIRKQTSVGNWRDSIYDGKEYRGYYTQEEAREVVEYAAKRYITVIPEIELPGHALAAIAAYPVLSCNPDKKYEVGQRWGVFEEVFCTRDTVFHFLQNVFSELFDIFPSEFYHIGGDECPKKSWKVCQNCQSRISNENLENEDELQSYFIQRIEQFLNHHGKQIIGWDEILDGGLAPNATVMSWRGEKGGIKAAQLKHDVIMSPYTHCYLDYSQVGQESDSMDYNRKTFLPLEKVYTYDPQGKVDKDVNKYIIGVQGNVWTEYMKTPQRVAEQIFPRAFALAEIAWTEPINKNYDGFKIRLLTMFERMKKLDMNYSHSFYSPVFHFNRKNVKFPLEIIIKTDYPDSSVFYTTDGSVPDNNSNKYIKPIYVSKGVVVKAATFKGKQMIGEVKTLKTDIL